MSSYRWEVQLVLEMLSPVFAAGGWWFLSRLEARDSVQKSLLAKAYLILGLQFSATGMIEVLQLRSAIDKGPFSTEFLSAILGCAVGAVGFFLASRAVVKVDAANARV
ncbi:MAG: hypothetical protein ACYC19_10215 [Acidimicrobiales bacterium]